MDADRNSLLTNPCWNRRLNSWPYCCHRHTDAKGPDAKPQPVLLTSDEKVRAAAAAVLSSGEYKAGPNETVLLHAPAGLAAKRLLIVGLGKKAKATVHAVRNAAGTAVRYTKPRAIRELVFALPEERRTWA